MTLKDRIGAETKDAMRARDAARLSTLRLLLAAIKQREVDERKALSEAEIDAAIDEALAAARAAGGADPALMGKVMGALKPKLAGRADMAQVSAKVKSRL